MRLGGREREGGREALGKTGVGGFADTVLSGPHQFPLQ